MADRTDAQQRILDAITLLINSRDRVLIEGPHLLSLCRQDPTYARSALSVNETQLKFTQGACQAEISALVRDVEWEILGPNDFLQSRIFTGSDNKQFIEEKLSKQPDEFDRDSLMLLRQFGGSLGRRAEDLLAQRLVSFAERLAAEPPGLSEDLASLKETIADYGFADSLNECLQKVDESLENQADQFDIPSTMRHLRSFFEALHEHVGGELRRQKPDTVDGTNLNQCGQAIDYLQRKGVLTEKFKDLGRNLYSILSDGDFGVYAIKATRDYSRMCRNMVVEYALTLMLELERRLQQE